MTHPVESTLPTLEPPDFQTAWEKMVDLLRPEMTKTQYENLLRPIRPLGYADGVYRAAVATENDRLLVINRLKRRIVQLLGGIYEQDVTLEVEVDAGGPAAPGPSNGKKPARTGESGGSRRLKLQLAYGDERAAIIRPERIQPMTHYFRENWGPILGPTAAWVVHNARGMCFWNIDTGEMRNTVDTTMQVLAEKCCVSVRTLKTILHNEDVRRYFIRYTVRRVMTTNGIRTAGISMCVRMDEPLTPYDQETSKHYEDEAWTTIPFDEDDDEF